MLVVLAILVLLAVMCAILAVAGPRRQQKSRPRRVAVMESKQRRT